MSKDSNFTGQPVYSQVLKLLDRDKIMQISRETTAGVLCQGVCILVGEVCSLFSGQPPSEKL